MLHTWMQICCGAASLALQVCAAAAQPPVSEADGVDCAMLARMPNPPMSVQACEQRMATQRELERALDTPGGERPGDDALSCAAIHAEMRAMKINGVSPQHAAQGQAAASEVAAALDSAHTEAMHMAAAQGAQTAAAAAVPGNATADAVARAQLAEQQALQARTAQRMGPARERMATANTQSLADLAQAMRTHPRFARLVRLGMARHCME